MEVPKGKSKKEEVTKELGNMTGYTGERPSDAIIKSLKDDPEKMEEFLKGAEQGQIEANDKPEE